MAMVGSIIIACNTAKKYVIKGSTEKVVGFRYYSRTTSRYNQSHEVIFEGKVEIVSNELRELRTWSVISNLQTQFLLLLNDPVCMASVCGVLVVYIFIILSNRQWPHGI